MGKRAAPGLITIFACALIASAQTPEPAPAQTGTDAKKPDALKAFAEVVKDASIVSGLFTLYRTEEDKVFLELLPNQLEKIYKLV